MVNPKSELYEKHPDLTITLPKRKTYYYRNQLVLDLANPEVQDFVYGFVDQLLTENQSIAYIKWDCNSPITNVYSHYLKDRQSNLYIDHNHGFYKICELVRAKYRDLKPANILEDENFYPKIEGTPIYAAPEIFKYEYLKTGDVYAFSMIVYELLTLDELFKNYNYFQLLDKVAIDGERPKFNFPIPNCYINLITGCRSSDPKSSNISKYC